MGQRCWMWLGATLLSSAAVGCNPILGIDKGEPFAAGGSGGAGGNSTGGGGGGSSSQCGDGTLEGNEQCDDGNVVDHDGCSSACINETLSWTKLEPDVSPPRRSGFGLAYHQVRQRIILFGGRLSGGDLAGDSWEYQPDDNEWEELDPTGAPDAREGHAFTSTGNRGVLVFAGSTASGVYEDDVWELLTNWAGTTPVSSPLAGWQHAAAFDSENSRFVVFGGRDGSGILVGTSVFASGDWTSPLTTTGTPPSPRYAAAMAYDAKRQVIMLFGGQAGSGALGDAYELDGNDVWTPIPQSGPWPPERRFATMAYDSAREVVVLYGGVNASGQLNDTWEYDGTDWIETSATGRPTASADPKMDFDAASQLMILSLDPGAGDYNETWQYRYTSP